MKIAERLLNHKTKYGLIFISDVPVTYHCYHFNLFLDQTMEDALGDEAGINLKIEAAHQAYYRLLEAVERELNLTDSKEKLEAFSKIFSELGLGTLQFEADESGGTVKGKILHYSLGWLKKYGEFVLRQYPIDAVAAGFAAAALELAYSLPYDSFQVSEKQCRALKSKYCQFNLFRKEPERELSPLSDIIFSEREMVGKKLAEDKISEVAGKLASAPLFGNEDGIIEAFGIYVTLQPTEYYNYLSYHSEKIIREENPQLIKALEDLLRESGHVCGFNTMGAILSSPESEALFGKLTGTQEEIFTTCCGISRALGFGNWSIEKLEPNLTILRKTTSYETPYYIQRHGEKRDSGHCYLFQGVGEAIMRLAKLVNWNNPPKFNQDFYNSIFKGENRNICSVNETKCMGNGDPYCELEIYYHK